MAKFPRRGGNLRARQGGKEQGYNCEPQRESSGAGVERCGNCMAKFAFMWMSAVEIVGTLNPTCAEFAFQNLLSCG